MCICCEEGIGDRLRVACRSPHRRVRGAAALFDFARIGIAECGDALSNPKSGFLGPSSPQ